MINKFEVTEITADTVTVKVDVIDNESGIEKIEYSKDDENYVTGITQVATEYRFKGLKELTEYTIKVKVTDNAENETELSKQITTNEEKFSDIYTETTKYTDSEGNVAWIPGGFAVGTTEGINKISTGLVITDAINENHNSIGNQFVWIPVGTYNTSRGEKTNNLTRRCWAAVNVVQDPIEVNGDIPIGNNLALVGSGSVFCGETYSDSSLAYNTIQKFINSAKSVEDGGKGGFYIGRYEQGNGNVCKKNQLLYTNLTGSQASAQAQLMYNGNEYITSELISSYAWDTALNFICQTNQEGYLLATVSDSDYSNTNFKEIEKTGEYMLDKYNNIYDLLGNATEITTEFCSNGASVITRGNNSGLISYGAARNNMGNESKSDYYGFRVQLYIK